MQKLLLIFLLILSALHMQAPIQRVSVHLSHKAVLSFERTPFKATGKVLRFYETKEPNVSKVLIAIDGKPFFGTDGEAPKYVLSKATLLLNGITYNLRVDKMYNPWFGNGPNEQSVSLRKIGNNYKLSAVFSDGAGSYLAEWLITGKVSVRTMLTADEDVIVGRFLSEKTIGRQGILH